MLKGKSTIQLFDAKTGKEVKRVENENMITNAISNILNVPLDFYYSMGYKPIADMVLPIQTVGLAGLLIWDNTIPENADIVYPPENVREVGHAGDAYSGTNAYRGSYNSNESGAIEGGYRHVWDFATDKANGEIKCLSLTSRSGGNCGYHYDDSTGYNIRYIYQVCSNSSVYGNILGRISKNKYAFINSTTGNTVKINYGSVFDSAKITLKETTGSGISIDDTKTFNVTNTYGDYAITKLNKEPILYCSAHSGLNVWYCKINYDTGDLLTDTTVTLSIPDQYESAIYAVNGVNDDGIYVCLYDTTRSNYNFCVARFTLSGEFVCEVSDIHWSGKVSSYIYCVGDKWYVSDTGITSPGDKLTVSSTYVSRIQCYDYDTLAPLYLCPSDDLSYSEVALALYNTYLGTINNLATPVTKTNAQTMKITYDLIQG